LHFVPWTLPGAFLHPKPSSHKPRRPSFRVLWWYALVASATGLWVCVNGCWWCGALERQLWGPHFWLLPLKDCWELSLQPSHRPHGSVPQVFMYRVFILIPFQIFSFSPCDFFFDPQVHWKYITFQTFVDFVTIFNLL
jgi:hypothetical protein